MQTSKSISRRNFIEKAAVTAGLTAVGYDTLFGKSSNLSPTPSPQEREVLLQERLPREVWIATVSQEGMSAETTEKMAEAMLGVIGKSVAYRPDIVCLPEYFLYTSIQKRLTLPERVEISENLSHNFAAFARTNRCYLIYPVFTRENGKIYNAAVVFDRQGNRMGEYRKTRLPLDELEMGITPGPLHPPVFKTDFGIIGIQICYDILWFEGWEALRRKGAEIVFWPSAYPAGRKVNAMAWQHRYAVATSTRGTSKICDISGDVIAQNGFDRNLICAPVNLEKTFIPTWLNVKNFDNIRAKYGRKIKFTTYQEEGWTVMECLSPDVRLNDILKEYNIKTTEQMAYESEEISIGRRV